MSQAKIFQSGNSQAVRLPKEFRFDVETVEIYRRGDEVILKAIQPKPIDVFDCLANLPNDFMTDGREDLPPQERESF